MSLRILTNGQGRRTNGLINRAFGQTEIFFRGRRLQTLAGLLQEGGTLNRASGQFQGRKGGAIGGITPAKPREGLPPYKGPCRSPGQTAGDGKR